MAIYQIKTFQKLPIGLEQAWEFLSSPYNLNTITPEDMDFKIMNDVKKDDKMFQGQIIVYQIKPFTGYTTNWVTEITHVKELKYFVDEQRFGPYQFWHHLHTIKAVDGGVSMEDTIHYKIPFGWLGQLLHFLFIKRKLKSIFKYRKSKLEELFGKLD